MTKLIYHSVGKSASVSPIDEAIIEMVTSKPIKIACPYLGQNLLQRMVDQCAGWQLLTDVEELLRSQGRANRDRFAQFLIDNENNVRHCKRLHAKVIVAGQQALVGSANFTHSGLTQRAEMSVLLSDKKTVDELETWFDELWKRCSPIEKEPIVAFAKSLPESLSTVDKSISLSLPTGPQIDSMLKPVTKMRDGRWTEEAYLALVEEKWPDLLVRHTELIDSLKEIDAIQFSRGDGPKEATYHAVLPNSDTSILRVFANGKFFVCWENLEENAATRYKELWPDLNDTSNSNGCNLEGGITNVEADRIVETILSMQETVAPKAATISEEKRRAAALEFLKSKPGQEFSAAEISTQKRGVPKAVVFKLLDGVPGVVITERGGKRYYSFKGT